jgi:ATP-dependent DNA helicase PIF1
MCGRAIVTARNVIVDKINDVALDMVPDEKKIYRSCEKPKEESALYPLEVFHDLVPPGFPPHQLKVKVNSVVMLLRNLDLTGGHCNGSRYLVNNMFNRTLELKLAHGPNKGKCITIPRIPFTTREDYPFSFTRVQFPIKLAFGITANKSQGQTMKKIGVFLDQPFFSHGQLYVATSRVGSSEHVKFAVENGMFRGVEGTYTDNVVFPECL